MRALAVAVALAACSPAPRPPPGSPEALTAYLQTVAGADLATRQREVTSWQLDAAGWNRTVIATYRPLYADYARAFAAASPALVDRLAAPGPVTARRHFADDPGLTPRQVRDRWALPTLFPSLIARTVVAGDPPPAPGTAGPAAGVPAAHVSPIDTVFVLDDGRWRALLGLDETVRARVAALDADCALRLGLTGPPGRCTDLGAAIVDAALRTDRDRLAHVCRLAETLCGKGSP